MPNLSTKQIIGLAVTVELVALFGIVWLRHEFYDHFTCHNLGMSSEKSSYSAGNAIRLAAVVTPNRPHRLRLYRERQKSFCLFLRRATETGVDYSDNDFSRCTDPIETDLIDTLDISPETPYVLEIEGKLSAQADGQIVFDFGRFGSFTKQNGPQFLVGGFWRPIRPAPEDSLEDSTDMILITVEQEILSSVRNPSNHALEWTWPSSSEAELK